MSFFDSNMLIILGATGSGEQGDDMCEAMLRSLVTLRGGDLDEQAGFSNELLELLQPREASSVGRFRKLLDESGYDRVLILNYYATGYSDRRAVKAAFRDRVSKVFSDVQTIDLPDYRSNYLLAAAPIDDRQDFFDRLELGEHAFSGRNLDLSASLVKVSVAGVLSGVPGLESDQTKRERERAEREKEWDERMTRGRSRGDEFKRDAPRGREEFMQRRSGLEESTAHNTGPVDPKDYAKLATMLTADSPFDREKAAKRLLEVDPKTVTKTC